jgi:hypothetical protein
VSDIEPLNWIQKLSHYCRMSLGFQVLYAGCSWWYLVTSKLPCADCSAQWCLVAEHAQWTSMGSRTAYSTWTLQKPTLFRWPLSPWPFNFGYRCFGLYRYMLTQWTLSRSSDLNSWDTLYTVFMSCCRLQKKRFNMQYCYTVKEKCLLITI